MSIKEFETIFSSTDVNVLDRTMKSVLTQLTRYAGAVDGYDEDTLTVLKTVQDSDGVRVHRRRVTFSNAGRKFLTKMSRVDIPGNVFVQIREKD